MEDRKGTIWDEDIDLETRMFLQFMHYLQNLPAGLLPNKAMYYLATLVKYMEWDYQFCAEDVGLRISDKECSGWHYYGHRIEGKERIDPKEFRNWQPVNPKPYWDELEWVRMSDGTHVARSSNAIQVEADIRELGRLSASS